MITIIIVPGPPALGKTTFIKKRNDGDIISPDHFVYNENGIYEWTPDRAAFAWENSYNKIKNLEDGSKVYFDATLTSKKSRTTFKNKIKSIMGNRDYKIAVINLPKIDFSIIQERNNSRTPDRKVPDSTIVRMFEDWEPAMCDEGFEIL
jgi:predicted kinase